MALVKCKECGSKVSTKAEACPGCGAKVKKESGCAALIVVLLIILIFVAVFSPAGNSRREERVDSPGGSQAAQSAKVDSPPAAQKAEAGKPSSKSYELAVTNLVVKKVDANGSKRFRYFFAAKNNGKSPFEGEINIKLHTRSRSITEDNFNCKILPGLQGVNHLDARTGPVRFHGDAAYVEFSYVAKVGGSVVASGRGPIAEKFEDLSE